MNVWDDVIEDYLPKSYIKSYCLRIRDAIVEKKLKLFLEKSGVLRTSLISMQTIVLDRIKLFNTGIRME
jgi:hypothetical protein